MKKITLFVSSALIAGGIFFTTSCNKATVDSNTTTTSDNQLCESEFMRVVPQVNSLTFSKLNKSVERVGGVTYPIITATDTVTNGNGWPRTLTINYGSAGVVDPIDGKTRKGVITVSFTNYWHDIGTTATITYSNYFVNSISYSATLEATRKSPTQFGLDVVNGVCKSTNWVIQYGSSRILTWTNGISDSVFSHSAYMITGSGYGVDRNTVNFKSAISSAAPMTLFCNCASLITSGTVTINPAGLATRTVNYGSGACSSTATVTIDGQNYTINK